MTARIHKDDHQRYLTQIRIPFYKNIVESLHSFSFSKLDSSKGVSDFIGWLKEIDFHNVLFLKESENTALNEKESYSDRIVGATS
jgi:hypothetical protein